METYIYIFLLLLVLLVYLSFRVRKVQKNLSSGQLVLITGGAQGLGFQIARQFAINTNFKLVIVDI
jgi:FlaA1/EpsC-like NDP-sugar epimerase